MLDKKAEPSDRQVNKPEPWLQTERLRLREFVLSDRDALVKMHKDPRVRSLLVDDYPFDRHVVANEFLENLQAFYRQHKGLGIWCAEYLKAMFSDADIKEAAECDLLHPAMLEKMLQKQVRFAGWFNLMPLQEQPGEVELGSRLLPEVWGTGLALEGGEKLLEHAFNTLGFSRVWAVSHIKHKSVRYCVATLGFRDKGVHDYDGQAAQYYVIEKDYWQQWRKRSLKEKKRHAVAACRGVSD